jgi:hypothetical protein
MSLQGAGWLSSIGENKFTPVALLPGLQSETNRIRFFDEWDTHDYQAFEMRRASTYEMPGDLGAVATATWNQVESSFWRNR